MSASNGSIPCLDEMSERYSALSLTWTGICVVKADRTCEPRSRRPCRGSRRRPIIAIMVWFLTSTTMRSNVARAWTTLLCHVSLKPRNSFDSRLFLTSLQRKATKATSSSGSLHSMPKRRSGGLARREDCYSIHDVFADGNQRPYPPAMNSQDEEDGFGAYEYDMTLDPYEQAELEREEQLASGNTKDATSERPLPSTTSVKDVSQSIKIPQTRDRDDTVKSTSRLPAMPISVSSQPLEYTHIVEESVRMTNDELSGPSTYGRKRQASSTLPDATFDNFQSPKNLDVMAAELASLEVLIYEQNNGKVFNLNSTKQVGTILFGTAGGSTNKDVLDAMASAGNRMADLIIKHRALKYQIAKLVRRKESVAKGTAVHSASTVARVRTKSNTTVALDGDDVALSDVTADPLLLLDASAYIFRAYYSMPPIHRSDGMPTGAVMGFCKMLNSMLLGRMLQGEQPRLVLCFDAKGKTFRHELYGDYKGNRPSAPMDLVPQFELVRQAAKAYGICQIEALSFEADDVIATLATMAVLEGVDANILSGDKDLMQLVTDLDATPSIQMIDPVKKDRTTYKEVVEKWEVPPNKLGDVLALSGDTADNIPGVKGIGPKNAAKLINEFDSLDKLLMNIESVKQKGLRDKLTEYKGDARLSRVLVELNRTVPLEMIRGLPDGVDQRISDLRMEPFDPERILLFYDQMGFKELRRTFEFRLKGVKVKRKASSYARTQTTVPQPHDYSDVPF